MKKIEDYTNNLLIGNKDLFTLKFDMGDSPQRTGSHLIFKRFNLDYGPGSPSYESIMSQFEIKPGIYVRAPDPIKWWGRTDVMSRDQIKPLIVAMGFFRDTERLNRLLKQFLKRFMFCQNTRGNWDDEKKKIPDFAGPDVWANFIRSYDSWFLYPLLLLCDLHLLGNSFIRIYKSFKDPDDVGDDLNHCVDLAQSFYKLPTPISWFARKLYFKLRKSYYSKLMDAPNLLASGPQFAFDWYYRSSKAPPMNEEWRPILSMLANR